jgi:uncharacterized protein (TIGR02996 family)
MRVPKTPKPREPRPSAKGSVAEPRPLAPRGSVHFDDHDVTARRVLHDLGELNDDIPEIVDAGDSIEMTAQRPLFDPNDSVEMTAERSPLLDTNELPPNAEHHVSTDLDGTVIEVDAEPPEDMRTPPPPEPPPGVQDRERFPKRAPTSHPRVIPRGFGGHDDAEPEVTAPRAPALGTQKKNPPRKQPDGPGETFEHLETRALDEFMEPTRIQQPIHEMEDRPTTNLDPGERGLLAAIAEGSEPSRLKYADWLQRHGEGARAEYLRVDHELAKTNPSDPKFDQLVHRRTDLAARISVDWRSRVSRSPIEGCSAFDRPCPSRWAALTADADDVRACQVCRKEVYYCATIQLAQGRVRNGDPVAIDVTCQRWPGDLGGHCVQCNSFVPSEARFCPHCGQSMQLVIHMA